MIVLEPQNEFHHDNKELFNFDEASIEPDDEEWNMSEAVLLIDSFVSENKSLEEVKKYFFGGREIDQKDVDFLEHVYIDKFWGIIPERGETFITDIILKNDASVIFKWVTVVYGNKSEKEFFQLFETAQFYDVLKMVFEKMDETKVSKFFVKMKKVFGLKFQGATKLKGLLGVYRSLVYCNINTKRSTIFCDAVNHLWAQLFGKDEILKLKPEDEKEEFEHMLVAKLIKDFDVQQEKEEHLKFIKERLQKMFEPIRYKTYSESGETVFEVSGRDIVWSEIAKDFKERYDPSIVDQIRISAIQEITLNESLKFPSINFSIIAPKIIVPNLIILNLSGEDAADTFTAAASSGTSVGENGKDGDDGIAGKSSGNLAICTSEISEQKNFKILLNGGKGSIGQNGGNGANGAEGTGCKFDEVLGFWRKVGAVNASVMNTLFNGHLLAIVGGFHKFQGPKGTTRWFSTSTYRPIQVKIENSYFSWVGKVVNAVTSPISSTHIVEYYEGTKGSEGGRGGKNGNGGEGGKKGTYSILNQGENEINLTKIEANDGSNGKEGKPGNNGEYGKDGWDVGYTRKTLEGFHNYGENHNQKFELKFINYYAEGSLYNQGLDTGDGSCCYLQIKTRQCTPQVMKESEKTAEKKKESERKAEAIARKTNSINLNAVQERFEGLCKEKSENEKEQEMEEEEQTESQVNRIAETFDIPKEPKYIPKERHEIPIIPEEVLSALGKENPAAWNDLWKATTSASELTKLADKLPNDKGIKTKFKKKFTLTMLRHHLRSSKGQFARIVKKLIDSRKNTELKIMDLIRRKRMLKKHEFEVRNCAPFLIPRTADSETIDVCAGVLTENPTYENVFSQAFQRILSEALSIKDYEKYAAMLSKMDKIEIEGKTIKDLKTEYMKTRQLTREDKEQINKMIQKEINKDVNFKKLETDVIILIYTQVYEKLLANQVLADAFKLWLKTQTDETLLDKYPKIFGEEASVATWLELVNDKEQFELFKTYVSKHGVKSAAGRLILAFETKVNLRIYNGGSLIEDHMPGITGNVQHLEVNAKTGKFNSLSFRLSSVILENERKAASVSFQKRLFDMEEKFECPTLLPTDFIAPMQWCANCNKSEEGKLSLDQLGILQPKLLELLAFINPNGIMLYEQLEILCLEFSSLAVAFVDSMLNVFLFDGCHIDFTTFKYLLETVFVAFSHHIIHNKFFFPSIIFSTEQSEWIDEFFIFNSETSLQTSIERKADLLKRLKKVKDDNLKILCSSKLQTERINYEELLEIADVMKDAFGAYPDLLEVELNKWPTIIKDNQVYIKLNNQSHHFLNDEQRNLALFWCVKLATAKIDICEIEKVFAILGSQSAMEFDQKVFGRLVQRLCNNEIAAGQTSCPSKIFACAIAKMPNFSKIPESLGLTILRSDKEIEEELTKKSDGAQYSYEEWITILRKRNEESTLLSFIFEKFEKSATENYAEAVRECVALVKARTHSTAIQYKEAFERCFAKVPESDDFDSFLLVIISNVIAIKEISKRGYHLRLNQFVAAVCAIRSKTGLLQQLATGEGKSLIVTAVSIASVLKGNHVNIVTSSPALAKRDTECQDPVGCLDIYEAFGIKASHICIESPSLRSQRYAENDIIYGDLTSFQRDWLLDEFYAMNIVGSRRFDVVVVDEVDSMLLDQGSNMLYLSHEIPDLEMLQSLFVKIWQIINGSINQEVDDKMIYQAVYRSVFPLFAMQYFGDTLSIGEDEAEKFVEFLINKNVITDEGEIQMTKKSTLTDTLKTAKNISKSTITRFIYAYDKVIAESRLDIPQHLLPFVKRHLKEFISNAKSAFFMEEGIGYQVDIVRSDTSLSYQPKVIIIDQGTGVDLPTTQWSNGLHQFLQLKHSIRLTPVSMKAVFTSNVSFLKKFGKLFGFSGTLGAAAERKQLSNMYNLECLILPSSIPKQFYEEPSIVTTVKEDGPDSHVHQIYKSLSQKMAEGRSVLVICESIKQVTELSEKVKKLAKENNANFKSFRNAVLYRRDHEKFIYADGTEELPPKKIIYSTNLAGRGTDIRLTKELRQNGGLHVIVAFLPENLRVEEQAFGRAARCGDEGTAQLIIYANPEEHGKNLNVSKLKLKRNAQEVRRINKITDYYNEKLLIEEKCFEIFGREFKNRKTLIDKLYVNEELNMLASRDLLDQWALWLDKTGHEKPSDRIGAAEEFCKNELKYVTKNDLNLTQPLNVIKFGILEAISGNYDRATELFEWILQEFPVYTPEAKYYLTFIFVKQHPDFTQSKTKDYKTIAKMFEEARRGFEKRLYGFHNDRAIIEHYREEDKSRIFKTDAFSQQQMEMAQLQTIFIESIDVLLGGRVDSKDFATELINEEASILLHKFFTDKENFDELPITKTKIKADFDKEKLKKYCQNRGVEFQAVHKVIKNFKNGKVDEKKLIEAINPPTTDAFWKELTEKSLVKNIQQHLFVNTAKFSSMNTELADLVKPFISDPDLPKSPEKPPNSRIYQYSVVLEDGWKKLNKSTFEKSIRQSCIEILTEIDAICYTDSGELCLQSDDEISGTIFKNFNYISKNDFVLYGIPESEVDHILEVLVKTEILDIVKPDKYGLPKHKSKPKIDHEALEEATEKPAHQKPIKNGLSIPVEDPKPALEAPQESAIPNIDSTKATDKPKLPNCFHGTVMDILKQKLAYVIAFRDLHVKLHESQQPKILLPTLRESSPAFDFIDLDIFERSNINLNGLKKNSKKLGSMKELYTAALKYAMDEEEASNVALAAGEAALGNMKKIYNYVMDNEEASNVALAANEVAKQCKLNITKSSHSYDKKSKHYDEIKNEAALAQFQSMITSKAPGIQRFETLDAELQSLWKKLDECNLIELRTTCMMTSHGSTHIISLQEKKWSWKTITKLALVTLGAVAQLVVGGVILVFSAGSGVMVANFFISEGISDIIYVIKGACSGYADNYKQHKIMSMLASGILCGVGSFFAWGGQFNPVSHGIFGTGWSSAATGVNQVALKGGALIAKASVSTVMKECGKQIAKRVGSALLNLAIFTALQQGLKYLMEEGIKIARNKIMEKLKAAFNQLATLKTLIAKVFAKLGVASGKSLVMECGNQILHGNSNDWMNEFCDFVFVKYRHLFLSIGQGMAEGMGHKGSSSAAKIQFIMTSIPKIFLFYNLTTIASSMHSKLKDYFERIEQMVEVQYENRKSVTEEATESANETTISTETASIIESWEKQMSEIVDKALESRIAMPLLTLATSAIQRKLESMVSKCYDKFKTKMDKEKLIKLKKEYEESKASGTEVEIAETRKNYENKLLQLQKSTRSPEVYAKIILEGVKIDQTGATAVGSMIKAQLGQDVEVNITNENGDKFSHKTGDGAASGVKIINIDLSKQHYGSENNSNSSRNSCLYNEVIKQIPQLKDAFSNDTVFRHGLANVLQTDPYFRQHIQKGWHSIAIEKGLIGGEILEKGNPVKVEEILKTKIRQLQKTEDASINAKKQLKQLPGMIKSRFKNCSDIEGMMKEELAELGKLIKEAEGMEGTGHANSEDLKQKQQKMDEIVQKGKEIVEKLVSASTNKSLAKDRNIPSLINEIENTVGEPVKRWNNMQEQLPSQSLTNKMKEIHAPNYENQHHEALPRTDACKEIAMNLQGKCGKGEGFIFESETAESGNRHRENHTIAVGVAPSEPHTLLVSANYCREDRDGIPGESFSNDQKQKLIDTIIVENQSQLTRLGIKEIKYLDLDPKDKRANETPQQFHHRAHAELFPAAFELQHSETRGNFSSMAIGVGKESCINCHSYFDNKRIPQNIEPGQVQSRVVRHQHPADIKFVVSITKPV